MGLTPAIALKPRVSSESFDVPEAQPSTERMPMINWSGETCKGSDGAPRMTNFPRTESPPRASFMALLLMPVANTTWAPPSFWSSSGTFCEPESRKWCAPSFRAKASLSLPRETATVRKHILALYCTAKWPTPPMPTTATTSPARAPLFRRELKVVIPAHMRGAASVEASSSGTRARAEAGATMDWEQPPWYAIPAIWSLEQLMKSPFRQFWQAPQWPPNQPTPTLCPVFHSETPA